MDKKTRNNIQNTNKQTHKHTNKQQQTTNKDRQSRPELNGCFVEVHGWVEETSRWSVLRYAHDGTAETFDVLPEKFVILPSTSDDYIRAPRTAIRKWLLEKTPVAALREDGVDAKRLRAEYAYKPTREAVTVNGIRVVESGQGRNGIYKPIIKLRKDRGCKTKGIKQIMT